MPKNTEASGHPNAMEVWQAWFDMTPEVWENVTGVAADYFEDYISFASSLQYTNQEYLRQLQPPFLTQQQAPTSSEKPVRLAPLPPVGARATRTHLITRTMITHFAEVSGDLNPIHLDPVEAARSPFGERIAHGSLLASFISAVLGNDLPGPGTIYMGQTLKFFAPVRIGDVIMTSVEVIAVREDKRILTLRTECTNQDGAVVLTGEAIVKYMHEIEAS
jgi:3-hydroxybutyryl-CoA dehydratase